MVPDDDLSFICPDCGEWHEMPFAYFLAAPDAWLAISDEDRARSVLDEELCVITIDEETDYFIRGNIEIPVVDAEATLGFTVWSTLSETNFGRALERWNTTGRESEPPYFGWLANEIWPWVGTRNLKVNVQTRPVGTRPFIELEPTNHPLAMNQRNGVTMASVEALARMTLHRARE